MPIVATVYLTNSGLLEYSPQVIFDGGRVFWDARGGELALDHAVHYSLWRRPGVWKGGKSRVIFACDEDISTLIFWMDEGVEVEPPYVWQHWSEIYSLKRDPVPLKLKWVSPCMLHERFWEE